MDPLWTSVRTQGELGVRPYERPPAPHPGPAGGKAETSLLRHQCPACGSSLRDDEELAAVPVGPGRSEDARRQQRKGEWYDAIAVVCHRECVGAAIDFSAALKVSAAAAMLREAAKQVAERAMTYNLTSDDSPAAALLEMAGHTEGAGHDLSGWEEQYPPRSEWRQ